MLPQGARLAVRPGAAERVLAWGFFLPATEDNGTARIGTVIAAGQGALAKDGRRAPLECAVGDVVIYSARTDRFKLADGADVDLIDEASVLGIVP